MHGKIKIMSDGQLLDCKIYCEDTIPIRRKMILKKTRDIQELFIMVADSKCDFGVPSSIQA